MTRVTRGTQAEVASDVRAIRGFRFGVTTSGATSAHIWRDTVRRIEELGYATLFVPDHFRDQLAPFPALAAAAMVSNHLRLGTLVLCNDFRHPAVMAKEAATLDVLSEGRLELGIGAGWAAEEYERVGIPFDRPGVRLDRLFEAVDVLTALFHGGPVERDGDHYRLLGLEGRPTPLQHPRPPLLIGGGGPRILRFAAQHADIVGVNLDLRSGRNLNPTTEQFGSPASASATGSAVHQRIEWIRDAAGDRFDQLELNIRIFIAEVTNKRRSVAAQFGARLGLDPNELLRSPHVLIGSRDQLVDDLLERRERFGLSYVVVPNDVVDEFAPVVEQLSTQ